MIAPLFLFKTIEGLLETAYLLRSPENAERLLRALTRAQQKQGPPQTVEELKREVGFGEIAEEGD
jgi:antitoxin YefM